MDPVKVCRVCLSMDVKMYDLKIHPLELYFEPLILHNPLSALELPTLVCYECASLIRKFYLFREKCIKGQSLLYNILERSGELTTALVKTIDRKSNKLKSNIALSLNVISEDSTTLPIKEFKEDSTLDIELLPKLQLEDLIEDAEIKKEVEGEADGGSRADDGRSNPEDDLDLFDCPMQMASSDDEPLSMHKSKKKKKKSGKRKDKMSDGDFISDIEQEMTQQRKIKAVRKVRGRPRKMPLEVPKEVVKRKYDEYDNVEDYCIVIRLTPEEQLEEVTKRATSSNYLNSQYKCDLCYKGFMNTDTWQHHMVKHDPSAGDVECAVCRFRFKNQRILRKHMAIHDMKFECKSCAVVCKTKTQAKQHQRWHKGVTYTCQHCEEVFSKWTSYLSHVRIKHPSQHICPTCGYSFVSQFGLAMHRSMMHKDEDGGIIKREEEYSNHLHCLLCDLQFTSEDAYKRHLVTSAKHSNDNTFSTGCKECGQSFGDPEQLRLHHRKEHARKRPPNYGKRRVATKWPSKCMHCEEIVANARDYWSHFRRAHPDLPYPIDKSYICEICGKGFRGNAFLKYHKRTHFEERAYKCAQCPKSFFNRTNLQMHEKTHSDSRPYPCQVCFKAFKSKGALDRHFRSHTGDKPYHCEVCGKAFNQSNSRKLHVRTVHLKQPAPYVSKSRMERRKTLQPKLEPLLGT